MPVYKGSNKIGAIYKGSNKIDKVYKGSILVYSSAYWLSYSFENLYYSLIPTTVSGKTVQNKLRITGIEGNSVVENQLIQNGDFSNGTDNFTFEGCSQNVSNNKLTLVRTTDTARMTMNQNCYVVANHKYLLSCKIKVVSQSSSEEIVLTDSADYLPFTNLVSGATQGQTYFVQKIIDAIGTGNSVIRYFRINNGTASIGDTYELSEYECIDLTQMFPFDTPTTLSDVRVQALLNRGYIEYNAGSIESVNISKFESEGYNLFDGEWTTSLGTFTNVLACDYIATIPGKSYTLEISGLTDSLTQLIFRQYDENKNVIKTDYYYAVTSPNSRYITLENTTRYIQFGLQKEGIVSEISNCIGCFHRTGTRTGYAPYTTPQTLTFHYQGSGAGTAHDTMAISGDNVVFTKSISSVDLGTLNYTYESNVLRFRAEIPDIALSAAQNIVGNLLCSKYTPATQNQLADTTYNKVISVNHQIHYIYIRDTDYSSESTFKTAMSGVMLEYELATPQTITIPLDHCGVVDLGSLNWKYSGSTQTFYVEDDLGIVNKGDSSIANIYCNKYLSKSGSDIVNNNQEGIAYSSNYYLRVRDVNYNDATAFKASLSGQYLYYETTAESKLDNVIDIEAGGTITTDSNVLTDVDVEIKCK